MEETVRKASALKLLGGRLSLDFANTADWHASDCPVEFLTSYIELVSWGQNAGILTGQQAELLLKQASHRSGDASDILKRAITLREAIYRIFSAISHGNLPQEDDLAALNTELSKALVHSRIVVEAEGFAWDWIGGEGAMDRMLWPVVHDAARLLTSKDRYRVGQCTDDKCGWLFLDASRNRSRRWCSMKDCGNRAKARRHYRRAHNEPRP